MPLIEIVEGDETSAETMQATGDFAQAIRKTADHLRRRCPGFVVNRILNSGRQRGLARAGGERALDQGDRRGRRRGERRCRSGPFHLVDLLGPRHRAARRRAPRTTSYGDRFYVPRACRSSSRQGKLGAKTAAEASTRTAAQPEGTASRTSADSSTLSAEDVRRGLPRARGGRRRPTATSTSA